MRSVDSQKFVWNSTSHFATMETPIQKVIIRHLAGTRANQSDEFEADKLVELSFGRDATNDIRFDPELDLGVSRQHGRILIPKRPDEPFQLIDNSRNGVQVNGRPIDKQAAFQPGDEIQIGPNGPRFVVDLFPPRAAAPPPTRLMNAMPTQEMRSSGLVEAVEVINPPKTGIGKQTFERAIGAERKRSGRQTAVAVGLVALVLGGIGFFAWKRQGDSLGGALASRDSLNAVLTKDMVALRGNLTQLEEKAKNQPLSDAEVGALVMDKVVKIELAWGLYDVQTGDPLWHMYTIDQTAGGPIPVFIKRADGNLEPYLYRAKSNMLGLPVSAQGHGTGFLVSKDGLMLTNRHVAASWDTRYSIRQLTPQFMGLVVEMSDSGLKKVGYIDQPISWVPSETQTVEGRPAQVEGRNSALNAVFPGSTNRRAARLVTASQIHDVALIRVEMTQPTDPIAIVDNYASMPKGEPVVCIGYPGVSPEATVVRKSNDAFKPNALPAGVANPTMTSGTVTNLIKSSTEFSNEQNMGDYYQLSINATGPGNSGGPLLNRKGQVIGIFSMSRTGTVGELITFAIPIKYGLELISKN